MQFNSPQLPFRNLALLAVCYACAPARQGWSPRWPGCRRLAAVTHCRPSHYVAVCFWYCRPWCCPLADPQTSTVPWLLHTPPLRRKCAEFTAPARGLVPCCVVLTLLCGVVHVSPHPPFFLINCFPAILAGSLSLMSVLTFLLYVSDFSVPAHL